jgi:hypothetical protein
MTDRVHKYVVLLERFRRSEIDAATFQKEFLTAFKNETTDFDEPIFEALDKLFGVVDSFEPNMKLRMELKKERPEWHVDELALRNAVTECKSQLDQASAGGH